MLMLKGILGFLTLGWSMTIADLRAAEAKDLLVLGVIAAEKEEQSVALLKDTQSQKVFAAKLGQEVADRTTIRGITREFVYMRIGTRVEKVRVGEQLDGSSSFPSAPHYGSETLSQNGGIERRGDHVRVTSALKDYVVGQNLSTVLMQAAAVPYYEQGQLKGFTLWEIDKGSIYELAGFQDGDTITAINGQPLTDVGSTIKMLHGLKGDHRAEVTLTRAGQDKTLKIEVQ